MQSARKGLWWKILLSVTAFLLIAVAATAVIIWKQNVFTLSLELNGEEIITVEFGEDFTDPGAESFFCGTILHKQEQKVDVAVDGEVNSSVVGTYELFYSASYTADYVIVQQKLTAGASRIVNVVDTQAPRIILESNAESYVLPGHAYAEEGYVALDNYDGDITERVERVEKDGVVTYTVADSSGNLTQVTRTINYNDPIPPTLTLKGQMEMYINEGSAFVEPGVMAEDNCDGDITDRVQVTGTVDTTRPGNYTLEYSVADAFGNKVTAQRRVTVMELPAMPEMPYWDPSTPITPNGKVIYLTFDDGPSQHTARLLDVLDTYGVKATFFVVNTGNMGVLSRMAASGHTVAMHSATHRYNQIYANENAYFNDLYSIQSTIQAHTGITPKILRFPGGSSNTISKQYAPGLMTHLSDKLKSMGYRYFDWNVDSRDADNAKSTEAVYANVINGCSKRNCSIVLQHDTKSYSVDAVELIIQWGLSNGYTFLPLDETSPVCEHTINN